MASTGFLGALGGFGEGLNQAGTMNRESELVNERAALDEARDIARERLRAGLTRDENIRQEGVNATVAETKATTDATAAEIEAKARVTKEDLDRTGRETVAQIGATSRENAAKARAENKSRFKLTQSTVSGRDGDRVVTTLTDGQGTAYELAGSKYWLPGAPQQAENKTAPAAAIQRLMENPSAVSSFETAYGYVPKTFVDKYVFTSNDSTAPVTPKAKTEAETTPDDIPTPPVDTVTPPSVTTTEAPVAEGYLTDNNIVDKVINPATDFLNKAQARSKVGDAVDGGIEQLTKLSLEELQLALPTGSKRRDELVKQAIASLKA